MHPKLHAAPIAADAMIRKGTAGNTRATRRIVRGAPPPQAARFAVAAAAPGRWLFPSPGGILRRMSGPEADLAPQPAAEGPAHVPAGLGLGLGTPRAGARAGGRAGAARALQASAGNTAVARLLQRDDSSGGVGTPTPSVTAPGDRSSAGGPAKPGAPDYKKLIADKDTTGIREINDYGPVAPADRIAMIHVLLEDTWWVGGSDREAIMKMWEAFGEKGILDAYAQNEALWDKCVAAEVNLGGLKALKPYRDKFGDDVKGVAEVYQQKNAEAVKAEMGRLNLGHVDDLFGAGGPAPAPGQEIIEVQQLAREIQRADDVLTGLYDVSVGTMETTTPPKAPGAPSGDQSSAGGTPTNPALPAPGGGGGSGGGLPEGGAPAQTTWVVDVKFSPEHPPPTGPPKGREGQYRSYDDVMAQFRKVTAARAVIASKSPALFAASSGKPGEAGRIAQMSPREAMVQLGRALNETSAAIERAGPMIADGRIDWRDFTPIHQKLWDGMPARSGLAWNSKLAKSVSKDVIGEYHSTEFWRTMGLASLAAAAFLFSEIATGGMATFLWAAAGTAAGGMQAGFSIQKYEALATAAQTATSKDTQLVTTEQVSEAQAAAVLDTAFAFLDAFMAAKGAVGGAKAAAAASRSAAREGLEGLAKLAPERAAEALRTAVRELGPQETIRRTGIPVDELVKLAGGEATAEGKALSEAAKDAAVAGPRAMGPGGEGAITPRARELAAKAHSVYEEWARLTPERRLGRLLEPHEAELRAAGIPPPRGIPKTFGHRGETAVMPWEIWISDRFLGKTISETDFAVLVDTIAHESEHAKDMFGVAQMRINDGHSAAQVAQELKMRPDIAKAAEDVQNGSRPGARLAKDSTREAELRGMWESVWGSGSGYRKTTIDALDPLTVELNNVSKRLDTAVKKAGGAEVLKAGDPAVDALVAEYHAADSAYKTAYGKYRALAEEVSAHEAGEAAGAAMRERFELVREFKQAQTDLKNAAAAWETSTNVLAKGFEGGAPASYAAKLDNWNAYAKWSEAMDEVRSTQRALANASAGRAP